MAPVLTLKAQKQGTGTRGWFAWACLTKQPGGSTVRPVFEAVDFVAATRRWY